MDKVSGAVRLLADGATLDCLTDGSGDEREVEALDGAVVEFQHLGEVVAPINLHDRERYGLKVECLACRVQENH